MRYVLSAMILVIGFATPVWAAGKYGGEWKGRLVAEIKKVEHCGFGEKEFSATVSGNEFTAKINQSGTSREFSGEIDTNENYISLVSGE